MSIKKIIFVICGILFSHIALYAQDSVKTIVAQKGDGIINVLRSQGINVNKYYERFLELNEGNIRKGSELLVGRRYYLPYAPDSFEEMGRKIEILSKIETPIFSKELHGIRKKDNSLENTVYYMVLDQSKSKIVSNTYSKNHETARAIAKELLSHGAKVYMIENVIGNNTDLGEYISIINRLYLKNNGQYQRLLVMNLNNDAKNSNAKITIAHHDKSKEGQKLALNIGNVLHRQSILKKSSKEYTKVFTDNTYLYLAKNALPVMTFIKIESGASITDNYEAVAENNISFSDLISKGVLQDYTNLDFEEED